MSESLFFRCLTFHLAMALILMHCGSASPNLPAHRRPELHQLDKDSYWLQIRHSQLPALRFLISRFIAIVCLTPILSGYLAVGLLLSAGGIATSSNGLISVVFLRLFGGFLCCCWLVICFAFGCCRCWCCYDKTTVCRFSVAFVAGDCKTVSFQEVLVLDLSLPM